MAFRNVDGEYTHIIRRKKFIKLLRSLPRGTYLTPNAVGNIAIMSKTGDQYSQIGYVDIGSMSDVEDGYYLEFLAVNPAKPLAIWFYRNGAIELLVCSFKEADATIEEARTIVTTLKACAGPK